MMSYFQSDANYYRTELTRMAELNRDLNIRIKYLLKLCGMNDENKKIMHSIYASKFKTIKNIFKAIYYNLQLTVEFVDNKCGSRLGTIEKNVLKTKNDMRQVL